MLASELRLQVCLLLVVSFFFSVAANAQTSSVPAPWIDQDIGSPALAGSASASNGILTVNAGGADIWGASDQFHFVYEKIRGDVDVRARIDSLTYASSWSKAGVMIRSSLSGDSVNSYALVSYSRGTLAQRRLQAGGLTTATAGPALVAPAWVRLTRIGDGVTTYVSTDGQTWIAVSKDSVPLGSDTYVGLAVTSHNGGAMTRAAISAITVTPLSLPSGQQHADIGAPAVAGSAVYANGAYAEVGAGADIWGTADQFQFVYQPVNGDADVIVRINSITYADQWSKAGLMIRESLAAGARHATTFVSAGKGYAFQRRPDAGGTSVSTAGGSGTAPGWLRLQRVGTIFTSYRSADGQNWTLIGSDSIPMATSVYVGMAVTSHNTTTATTVVADSFSVKQPTPVTNQPPTVSLTAPATGSSYIAPASIGLTASASDPEGQLARVEFYSGATLLGTAAAAPYTFTWASVPAGTYSLTARAYDAAGASATSAPVSVTVGSGTTTVPTGVAFQASATAALVVSYRLEIFNTGVDVNAATAVGSVDLGKPAPDAVGDITVSVPAFFSALRPGTYQATVAAVGASAVSRCVPVTFTR